MIDCIALLAIVNVACCAQCMSPEFDDIADGIETGNIIAQSDLDVVTAHCT